MTTPQLFAVLTEYLTGYSSLFYVAVVWLVGLACVDMIVKLVRGAWR